MDRLIGILLLCLNILLVKGESEPRSVCDDGVNKDWFLSLEDNCYFFQRGKGLSWHDAQDLCHERGSNLLSITSKDEREYLLELILESGSMGDRIWLGLHALGEDGEFRWVDGSIFGAFVDWDPETKDNHTTREKCVTMNVFNEGKWEYSHCSGSLHNFVCKKANPESPTLEPPKTTLRTPGFCPESWQSFENKCFKIVADVQNGTDWNEARNLCQAFAKTGDLASIHSKKEQMYLTSLLGTTPVNVWIGFQKIKIWEEFAWRDNTNTDFTEWNPGNPGNAEESCTEMIASSLRPGRWNSTACQEKRAVLCQMFRDPSLSTPAPPQPTECPMGYLEYRKECYKAVADKKVTWNEASSRCEKEKEKGHLVSINDFFEQAFVTANFALREDLWIGFFSVAVIQGSEQFGWSDGWPNFFTNWGPDQPLVNDTDYLCTSLEEDGTWTVNHCEDNKGYICKISQKTPPSIDSLKGTCPEGWLDVGTKNCYYLKNSDSKFSWQESANTCQKLLQNATLASFHSNIELQLLSPKLKDFGSHLWIGLNRNADNEFVWLDRSPVDFTNWGKEEQSRGLQEGCAVINTLEMTWNEVDCSDVKGFICMTAKLLWSTRSTIIDGPKIGISAGRITGIVVSVLVGVLVAAVFVFLIVRIIKVRRSRLPEIRTRVQAPRTLP